jgi:hypothetical protein
MLAQREILGSDTVLIPVKSNYLSVHVDSNGLIQDVSYARFSAIQPLTFYSKLQSSASTATMERNQREHRPKSKSTRY